MNGQQRHLKVFLADLAGLVEGAGGIDARAAPDCRRFATELGALRDTAPHKAAAVPFGLPVCQFWTAALEVAGGEDSLPGVRRALAAVGPWLAWTQNPNYRRKPPSPSFLDRYGYAVIAGPSDGPPALVTCEQLALGVLLLGPRAHYPLHSHRAIEVYVPLNVAEWWRGEGPWRMEPPGAVIHHASSVGHATRATDAPLLAIYLWSGDLATHARLIGAGRAAPPLN